MTGLRAPFLRAGMRTGDTADIIAGRPSIGCTARALHPIYSGLQWTLVRAQGVTMRLQVIVLAAVSMVLAVGNVAVAVGADSSPATGRDIAANCANCHGTDGRSRGGIPSIAGQDKAYLIQQLKDFRDGKRPSTIMQQLAKGYSDAQIDAAAAYLAAQKPNR